MIGTILRDYRIVTELGSGGMGTVYFAEHTVIGRRAAIKVLHKDIASEDNVSRFFTEAKAVNAIRHPNIVDITDFGREGDLHYIIMEMLEGETLGARLEGGKRLSEAATVRIASQVASAVGAVNDRGIVHRDIKPENIFLTNHPDYPDFVKVLDFGVVKLMGAPQGRQAAHKTQPGSAIGTPAYMSPEQCRAEAGLDHRSDIYSLGVVAYQMLTGTPPFEGDALEQMLAHSRLAPMPPEERQPEVSSALSAVVMKALEKKPERRFASMRELRQALEAAVAPVQPAGAPAPAPPPAPEPAPEPAPVTAAVAASPVPRVNRAAPSPAAGVSRQHWYGASRAPAVVEPTPQITREEAVRQERIERIERVQTRKVGSKLREIIANRIAEDRLSVPTMPVVALKCLDLLLDPNARFNQIAAVVETDPLIASRLLRIVNSPAYGAREPITSVEKAVSRLGLKPLKMLLIEMSAREVFSSRNPRIRESFRGIWEHCLAVGMLAREASAHTLGADGDAAYLAGLFHDVGKPVVAALLLEAERSLMDELHEPFMTDTLWLKVVDDSHRDVGAALAAKWNLPEAVAQAIAHFDKYDQAGGRTSCTNLVRYANALTKREGIYVGQVNSEEVIAVASRGRELLGLDELTEERLTRGLRERVEAITKASSAPVAPAPSAGRPQS
jgi:putative nucleotidyltransferase with HDIG domain